MAKFANLTMVGARHINTWTGQFYRPVPDKGDIFYLSCVGLWVTGQMREETIFGQMCFLFELFINSQIGKVLDIGGHFGQSLL